MSPLTFRTVLLAILYVKTIDCAFKFIGTRDEYSIIESYAFPIPRVHVECYCRGADDRDNMLNCNFIDPPSVCILSNSNETACRIIVKAADSEKPMRAFKIDRTPKRAFFLMESGEATVEVPRDFQRVKLADGVIYEIRKVVETPRPISRYRWFYSQDGENDLRTSLEVNDVFEKNVNKLGWLRCDSNNSECDVDEDQLKRNLRMDNSECPEGNANGSLNASHYLNDNGLLESEISGKTVDEISGQRATNVDVNLNRQKISFDYKNYDTKNNPISALIVDSDKSFNFDAEITVDDYANKLLHITVYELKATDVTVEIGERGNTKSIFTFYHGEQNETQQARISAYLFGPQWICAYPTSDFSRNTCLKSAYTEIVSKIRIKSLSNKIGYEHRGYEHYAPISNDVLPLEKTEANTNIKKKSALFITGIVVGIVFSLLIAVPVLMLLVRRKYRNNLRKSLQTSPKFLNPNECENASML